VQFLDYVPDEELPLLYASADITLFTSVYEGFGLVLLESLSSGTPVIGPPVGGVPDMIENDATGYIIERDPDSFAAKIEHVADHRETLRRMSTASRSIAEDQSWSQVAKSVADVYDEVVGSHDC
jgi:Glycosyltransferase